MEQLSLAEPEQAQLDLLCQPLATQAERPTYHTAFACSPRDALRSTCNQNAVSLRLGSMLFGWETTTRNCKLEHESSQYRVRSCQHAWPALQCSEDCAY